MFHSLCRLIALDVAITQLLLAYFSVFLSLSPSLTLQQNKHPLLVHLSLFCSFSVLLFSLEFLWSHCMAVILDYPSLLFWELFSLLI